MKNAGYKRNSIEIINIKEEGRDQSPTNEEKPIQRLLIMGEVMRKNHEEQILGFRKVFKIPNGVVPDQIKAKYNEEESVLKICMPKSVKQICGFQIEEVKEQEFGEPSHKVIKEFKVHHLIESRNKYGESDDEREEDGKEETDDEVKNSEVKQNVGEGRQEVSNKNIVIQSLLEGSDDINGVLIGREVDEEIIGGRKEKEIEEPKYEIEDRDVEVKEGTDEESSLQMKTSDTFEESMETKVKGLPKEPKELLQVDETDDITDGEEQTDIDEEPMLFGHVKDEICEEGSQAKQKVEVLFEATVNEGKGQTYNNECGDESGNNQESQVPKKQDYSDVKLLMRSSQLEPPLGLEKHKNHEVIGQRESHRGHEIEVQREISQEEPDGLKDIQVEASEEAEKANEQRDGVHVEISKEIDHHELEDIQVEARDENIKAKE